LVKGLPYSDYRGSLPGFTADDRWIFDGSPFTKTCIADPATRVVSSSAPGAASSTTFVSANGAYFLESHYLAEPPNISLGRTADMANLGSVASLGTLSPTADRYAYRDKVIVTSTGATLFQKAGYELLAFSPDGTVVLGIPQDATAKEISIFGADTGELVTTIPTPIRATSWFYFPDGRYVAGAAGAGTAGSAPGVVVCGIQTRNCTFLTDAFPPVAVSSKGILATATGTSVPHTLQFWTEDGSTLLGTLPLYDYRMPTAEFGELLKLAFSHDGTTLQTVYWGGETVLWCP
jgi:hypothetical protein